MKRNFVLKPKWFVFLGIAYFLLGIIIVGFTNHYDDKIQELSINRLELQNQIEMEELHSTQKLTPKKLESRGILKGRIFEIDKNIIKKETSKNYLSAWIGFLTPVSICFALIMFAVQLYGMVSIGDTPEQKKDNVIKRLWRKMKDDYNLGLLWIILAFIMLLLGLIFVFKSFQYGTELIETAQQTMNVEPKQKVVTFEGQNSIDESSEILQLRKERVSLGINLITIAGLFVTIFSVGLTYIRSSPKNSKKVELNNESD